MIASPDARKGSLLIHQNASLYQLLLDQSEMVSHSLDSGRTVYVRVVAGVISLNVEELSEGDGAEVNESDVVDFKGVESAKP